LQVTPTHSRSPSPIANYEKSQANSMKFFHPNNFIAIKINPDNYNGQNDPREHV